MYRNTSRDIYNDGSDITARADSDVSGKRFAAVAGPMEGNLFIVREATAGQRAHGVFKYDAHEGNLVGLARGNARVLTVEAGALLTAGQDVAVGSGGRAVPAEGGEDAALVVGYAVDAADTGDDAKVSLV